MINLVKKVEKNDKLAKQISQGNGKTDKLVKKGVNNEKLVNARQNLWKKKWKEGEFSEKKWKTNKKNLRN